MDIARSSNWSRFISGLSITRNRKVYNFALGILLMVAADVIDFDHLWKKGRPLHNAGAVDIILLVLAFAYISGRVRAWFLRRGNG